MNNYINYEIIILIKINKRETFERTKRSESKVTYIYGKTGIYRYPYNLEYKGAPLFCSSFILVLSICPYLSIRKFAFIKYVLSSNNSSSVF